MKNHGDQLGLFLLIITTLGNVIMKNLLLKGGVVATVSTLPAAAFAAVPAEVTTALTDLATDVATVGSALVVAAAAVIGLKWMKATLFG